MPKLAEKPLGKKLYDADFYSWTQEQAALLRAKRWTELDLENLAEEVTSVGTSEKKEIRNRMLVLLVHLLKWSYQANFRGVSWRRTIRDQRQELKEIIAESPSLKAHLRSSVERCYLGATLKAAEETGISVAVFPEICPFTPEQVLDAGFLPEELGHIGIAKTT